MSDTRTTRRTSEFIKLVTFYGIQTSHCVHDSTKCCGHYLLLSLQALSSDDLRWSIWKKQAVSSKQRQTFWFLLKSSIKLVYLWRSWWRGTVSVELHTPLPQSISGCHKVSQPFDSKQIHLLMMWFSYKRQRDTRKNKEASCFTVSSVALMSHSK